MSLTREQWIEMWEDVYAMEKSLELSKTMTPLRRGIINRIKEKIQSVIGQMESDQ